MPIPLASTKLKCSYTLWVIGIKTVIWSVYGITPAFPVFNINSYSVSFFKLFYTKLQIFNLLIKFLFIAIFKFNIQLGRFGMGITAWHLLAAAKSFLLLLFYIAVFFCWFIKYTPDLSLSVGTPVCYSFLSVFTSEKFPFHYNSHNSIHKALQNSSYSVNFLQVLLVDFLQRVCSQFSPLLFLHFIGCDLVAVISIRLTSYTDI